MRFKKMYAGVAQGDAVHLKDTPARPFEPKGQRERNGTPPAVEENLSGLGVWLRDTYKALMARLSHNSNGQDKAA